MQTEFCCLGVSKLNRRNGGFQGAGNPKNVQWPGDPPFRYPNRQESAKTGWFLSIRRGSPPHQSHAENLVRENTPGGTLSLAFRRFLMRSNAGETHKHMRGGGGWHRVARISPYRCHPLFHWLWWFLFAGLAQEGTACGRIL